MPSALIDQPDCRIKLCSERLEVVRRDAATNKETVVQDIPLCHLERLMINEHVQISSQAVGALLRAGIPLVFLSGSGRFLGGFQPPPRADGLTRRRQYERTQDDPFTQSISTALVSAKIFNQRRMLQRLAANRGWDITPDLDRLQGIAIRLEQAHTVDQLRGLEGAAAAAYFQAWAGFLPEEFPFERRSARPPHNAVNACISFGATFVYNEILASLHVHGLDAALGVFHCAENGRWSLALDLMEPFRPCFVEALALHFFSHRILSQGHFESKEGGVYLNAKGRRDFLLQYEKRIQKEFYSEHLGCRTTLRAQFEKQVTAFKAALEKPESFL